MRRAAALAAVALTPLVWSIGVLLLWLTPGWDLRSRLIGTLVLPGGLAPALVLEIGARSSCPLSAPGMSSAASAGGCVIGPTYSFLHPGPEAFNHVFGALVFVASVVLPIGAALYLAIRLRSRWSRF